MKTNDEWKEIIATNIAKHKDGCDDSYRVLGDKIGVSLQRVHQWKTGYSNISAVQLKQLCDAMDVPIEGMYDDVN